MQESDRQRDRDSRMQAFLITCANTHNRDAKPSTAAPYSGLHEALRRAFGPASKQGGGRGPWGGQTTDRREQPCGGLFISPTSLSLLHRTWRHGTWCALMLPECCCCKHRLLSQHGQGEAFPAAGHGLQVLPTTGAAAHIQCVCLLVDASLGTVSGSCCTHTWPIRLQPDVATRRACAV